MAGAQHGDAILAAVVVLLASYTRGFFGLGFLVAALRHPRPGRSHSDGLFAAQRPGIDTISPA